MFDIWKKTTSYKTEVIENIIGIGLPNRNKFINYGDISAENIYSGYAISRVFSEDEARLSFEFDAVYLHYLMSTLTKIGIPVDQSRAALQDVFDNFELSKSEQGRFYKRIKDYGSLTSEGVADKFIANLCVSDFPESYWELSRKTLSGQFSSLTKAIEGFAADELRASKTQ